jgi:hypothetical protein
MEGYEDLAEADERVLDLVRPLASLSGRVLRWGENCAVLIRHGGLLELRRRPGL